MSEVSFLANETQSFEEEGGAIVLIPPPSSQPKDVFSNAPPPAPPLPPLLPENPVQRKSRVRSFYWKPIPEERIKRQDRPNLWTLGRHSRGTSFHIDIRAIEELFGQHEDTRSPAAADRRMMRGRGSVKDLREQITILDSKRSMNISIFLKHLKKSGDGLLEGLLHGNSESCDVESLRTLLKLLPEDEEVKKLQMFSGDIKDLTPADAFMYRLIHVPRYDVRVEALLLKEEFFSSCSAVKQDISVVQTAITELLNCDELHNVLHLVLQAGNIMNAGGFAGNAVGFKLSSLLSLADTKANKPGMNLLHFVALEAQKKNLLMFPEKVLHVQQAARVCVDSIHVELSSLNERVHQVQINIQTDEDLLTQLHSFLKSADEALVDLGVCSDVMVNEGNALIDFFCEDKDTFKLDECFHIFQNFCSKFKKAVQENAERGAWEESRSKRLKELEDKRHSWAGHEGVGGVFGLRSSSETDVEAALKREGLLDLLRPHPQSPLSPPLRFRSGRRSRHQKVNSESTERCDVTSDPSAADTLTLPPIHSLSIAHSDTNTTQLHGKHTPEGFTKTKSDRDSNTTNMCAEKLKTHAVQETQHNVQTHTQQDTLRNDEVTFDPSHVNLGECKHRDQSESSTRGDDDDVQLSSQHANNQSLKSSDRATHPMQTSSRKSIPKTLDSKPRSSVSAKPSSASPKTSLSKSPHQRPVRTLTSSETQSLRKVVPISRSGSSGQQKSPVRGVTNSSSVKKKQVTRPPPEEKMCRATLRALGAPVPQNSHHRHGPGFARNTVASTTRRAVTPANRSNQSDPKHPPLTRTASLRLSHVLSRQQSPAVTKVSKAESVRVTSPAGHPRKSSGVISHESQSKSVKPVWR